MKDFTHWVEAIGAFGAFAISILALIYSIKANKRLERWQFGQRKEAQLAELVSKLADADTTHTVRPDATGNDRFLVVAAKMEAYENAFEKYKNYLSPNSRGSLEFRLLQIKTQSDLAIKFADTDKTKMQEHSQNYANGMAEFVLELSRIARRELEAATRSLRE
jgi:hypothetical protein